MTNIRDDFEEWHKETYRQPLTRWAHTYANMHVRCRWQGWLASHGHTGPACDLQYDIDTGRMNEMKLEPL